MALQIVIPRASTPARPEPSSVALYRCAASWPVCPVCAAPLRASKLERCPSCDAALPPEPVIGTCAMYGVIELRDAADGYHGSVCEGHARAVLVTVAGARLAVRAVNIGDMIEERMARLAGVPESRRCSCLPGASRLGPNVLGEVYCDACGYLMFATTIAALSELLTELRSLEDRRSTRTTTGP